MAKFKLKLTKEQKKRFNTLFKEDLEKSKSKREENLEKVNRKKPQEQNNESETFKDKNFEINKKVDEVVEAIDTFSKGHQELDLNLDLNKAQIRNILLNEGGTYVLKDDDFIRKIISMLSMFESYKEEGISCDFQTGEEELLMAVRNVRIQKEHFDNNPFGRMQKRAG